MFWSERGCFGVFINIATLEIILPVMFGLWLAIFISEFWTDLYRPGPISGRYNGQLSHKIDA
jgi:hypothetical protein